MSTVSCHRRMLPTSNACLPRMQKARELVEALRLSDLPYREAADSLIDVPDLSHIESTIQSYTPQPRAGLLARYAPLAASIAVFFVVGLLAGQHVFPVAEPQPTKWAVWVDRIANYQALYSRSTLAMGNPPRERIVRQMDRVSKAIGATITAPDLSTMQADFKYARLYKIDGQPWPRSPTCRNRVSRFRSAT